MTSESADGIQEVYKKRIDALIQRKGYRGQTLFCGYDGVNCPVEIFNNCRHRQLSEQCYQANEGKDLIEVSRLNDKIRELDRLCGLDYFLGVSTFEVWENIDDE